MYVCSAGSVVALAVCCILFACVVVAYFVSISMMVRTAHDKGCPWGKGRLWFIGIFTTPITLGVIVAGLPDRSQAGQDKRGAGELGA